MHSFWKDRINEHIKAIERFSADQGALSSIQQCADIIVQSYQQGGTVLFCGNGGSAADAQHLATELVSRFFKERKALDAEALTVNTSSLTAIGNDYGFDRVFARQVEAKGRPGDVLIGLSTSGTSKNVIEAMKTASQVGMKTIALIGGDKENGMARIANCCISVPAPSTPRVQEAHILIGHMICEYVEMMLSQ